MDLCPRCKKNEPVPGRRWCGDCLSYMRDARTKHRSKPRPEGLCSRSDCTNKPEPGFKSCKRCRERERTYEKDTRTEAAWRARQTRRRRRMQVFEAYGGAICVCCGEDTYEFLTMDHIDGGGALHRKELGSTRGKHGGDIYHWLRKNNFPPGFRVLCMNCNFSLGYHGYCPHHGWTQPTSNGRTNRPGKKMIEN